MQIDFKLIDDSTIHFNGKTFKVQEEAVQHPFVNHITADAATKCHVYTVEYVRGKKIAAKCSKKDEWDKVQSILGINLSFVYNSYDSEYGLTCCIEVSKLHSCGGVKFFKEEGYTIIPASLFIEHNQPATVEQPKWQSEFEVLSVMNQSNLIFSRKDNGKYSSSNNHAIEYDEKHMMDCITAEHNKVHSIKRKSDGATFTVGDKVHYQNTIERIASIFISSDNDGMWAYIGNSENINLSVWNPYTEPKLILSKDEIGIDLYEGEDVHVSFSNGGGTTWWANKTMWDEHSKQAQRENYKIGYRYFKTAAKRDEHLILNDKCLSIQDILDSGAIVPESPLCKGLVEALKKLVNT